MKATYTDSEGEKTSHDVPDAILQLPDRAAGFALIGALCPGDEVYIDTVKITKPKGKLTIEFGTDRSQDKIALE